MGNSWLRPSLRKLGVRGLPGTGDPAKQAKSLRKGIRAFAEIARQPAADAQPGAPLDSVLLRASPLYRKSRRLYLETGGAFRPELVSSPRTLGSAILLEPMIEYSPTQDEFLWAATDPVASRDPSTLLTLRSYGGSLFHEQNHRLIWKRLPPPPPTRLGIWHFLNYAESLVIATDMALGDQLGPEFSSFSYLLGATYDPGSTMAREEPRRRSYRNRLQAAVTATYLTLELHSEQDVILATRALHPSLGPLAERIAKRSLNLDRAFIERTNVLWQDRHWRKVEPALRRKGSEPLLLSNNPMDQRLQYLWAEKWFDWIGL